MRYFVADIYKLAATLKDYTNDNKRTVKATDNLPTLRKIKRAATQRTSRHKLQHILFCPSPPTTLTICE